MSVPQLVIPLPIRTPRLRLRLLLPEDASAVLDYKRESWADLEKWMIWTHPPAPPARTLADEAKFCQMMHDSILKRERLVFLAFDGRDGHLVGHGGLKCDWQGPMFMLGYAVRSLDTGKGYATEIALALTHYAFQALGAQKVTAFHASGNIGSQRVLEKAGFIRTGVLPQQHALPDGRVDDDVHYAVLRDSVLPALDVTWNAQPGGNT